MRVEKSISTTGTGSMCGIREKGSEMGRFFYDMITLSAIFLKRLYVYSRYMKNQDDHYKPLCASVLVLDH